MKINLSKINLYRRQPLGAWAVAAFLAGTIAIGVSKLFSADESAAPKSDNFSPYVAEDGAISLPEDYRNKFQHLGTWADATKPDKPADELHIVYTRPEDIQAYRRDGKFPDGAVLVKEVTKASSDKLTTGQVSWDTGIKIWFVMVKESKGRFPNNPLYDKGWGWALFDAKDPKKQIAKSFDADCKGCHIPAMQDNWVYIRGYPILNPALRK
jgi:hypothetical protein